jgi:hypothetical protein
VESSSYQDFALASFRDRYLDGGSVTGDYFTDTLNIGEFSLPDYIIGLATNGSEVFSEDFYGFMGVGYTRQGTIGASNESYPNIVNILKSQGAIGSSTFSLWLDDLGRLLG